MEKLKKIVKERIKSWPTWLALGSLIVLCVKEFAGIDISETVNTVMNALLPLLVTFGVVNNPTDRNHF